MIKKVILVVLGLVVLIAIGLFAAVRVLLGPDSVRSAVERQASAALGMPVTVGSARAHIWPRPGLTLTDFVVGQPAQVTLRRARVSTGLRPLLSRRVEDAEVVVENSRLDLPKLLATLAALGRGAAAPPATTDAPAGITAGITIVNVKTIALRDVELVANDRRAAVTLESSLTGDRLDISRLSVRADASALEATGAVVSLGRRVVRLAIEAERLDLDGFLQFATALSSPSGSAAPGASTSNASSGTSGAPLDLKATVRAAQGSLLGAAFTDLQTTAEITPSRVTLDPLSFGAFNGRVSGDIVVHMRDAEPEITVTSRIDGIDLRQLSAFAGQPSAVTGTLNGNVRVTGRGLDPVSALGGARGTGNVALVKGRLPGLQLVRPIVLAFGRPQGAPPEGRGEEFEKISATLSIGGGQVRTGDLRFESRDVDMTGAGALGVAAGSGGTLDFAANLMLSEDLSAQAGRDLVRYAHEGNRVVLPATITGTVSSPRVMIDQQQALKRALRNELQQRTKSLFERFLPGSKPK